MCSACADLLLTDRAVAAVSGESDFLRAMVAQHDATAQQTGARIVVHCGNDCIPWDLTVFEVVTVPLQYRYSTVTAPLHWSLLPQRRSAA